jgi:soluble lytic murein transglycosylase
MDVPLLPAVLLAPRPSGRLPMWTLLLSLAFATPLADSPLAECSAVARTEDGAPAMLATGICAWERGDPAGALVALGQVHDDDLQPYVSLYIARAYIDLARPAEATGALDGVSADGRLGLQLRLTRGHALIANGKSLEARPDLRTLLNTPVGDAARYWLAKGGEDRGDKAAAIATYRAVWMRSVRGPWSEWAEEALDRLDAHVPDATTAEGAAIIQSRADALTADKQPLLARDLLEMLHSDSGAPTPSGSGLALARARAAARDYPGAIEAYASVLGNDENARGSATDLFDYALAHARIGDYETAAAIYARVMEHHPNSTQADTASFKRGYMSYDERDCDSARPLLAEHVADHPRSPHAAEALWFNSRCAFLEGSTREGQVLLQTLLRDYPDSSLIPGARYWIARAHGMLGDPDAETGGLEDVLRLHPVTGYAWFAADRLGRHFEPRAQTDIRPLTEAVARQPDIRLGTKLYLAGLDDDAAESLLRVGRRSDKRTRTAVAEMLLQTGRIREARSLVSEWCTGTTTPRSDGVIPACLPQPERNFVEIVAASAGQSPGLSYAIMTAESALNPTVASAAGARGVMQVMPAEGPRMHAQVFGERGTFERDRLYDPSYNASLGAGELAANAAKLGDCLNGPDIPAVIASYNAGEEAVVRWLDDAGERPDADAWSEEIGYSETRKYVRRVLGFWMAYRWVYGDPELPDDEVVGPER